MPHKVGVMIPTYKRPDLLRKAVLQWIVQTVKPDLLCIHQNGEGDSYEWAIEDLKPLINIKFIHVPSQTKQHMWYALPLSHLLAEQCDVFLWADHDDIYYRNHVETKIAQLEGHDVTLSEICGVLFLDHLDYKYNQPNTFHVHAPGGMSSSMAFNRKFAQSLMMDLLNDTEYYYSDNVVAHVTMPKHDKHITKDNTTVFVSHRGSHSSGGWIDGIFNKTESA